MLLSYPLYIFFGELIAPENIAVRMEVMIKLTLAAEEQVRIISRSLRMPLVQTQVL